MNPPLHIACFVAALPYVFGLHSSPAAMLSSAEQNMSDPTQTSTIASLLKGPGAQKPSALVPLLSRDGRNFSSTITGTRLAAQAGHRVPTHGQALVERRELAMDAAGEVAVVPDPTLLHSRHDSRLDVLHRGLVAVSHKGAVESPNLDQGRPLLKKLLVSGSGGPPRLSPPGTADETAPGHILLFRTAADEAAEVALRYLPTPGWRVLLVPVLILCCAALVAISVARRNVPFEGELLVPAEIMSHEAADSKLGAGSSGLPPHASQRTAPYSNTHSSSMPQRGIPSFYRGVEYVGPLSPELRVNKPAGEMLFVDGEITPWAQEGVVAFRLADITRTIVARCYISETRNDQGAVLETSRSQSIAYINTSQAFRRSPIDTTQPAYKVEDIPSTKRYVALCRGKRGADPRAPPFAIVEAVSRRAEGFASQYVVSGCTSGDRPGPVLLHLIQGGSDADHISFLDAFGRLVATIEQRPSEEVEHRLHMRIGCGVDAALVMCSLLAAAKLRC